MATCIELVPLKLFSERLIAGWSMVPGYPLNPSDYAVTMAPPDFPKPKSNKTNGACWRNDVRRWEKAKRRLEAA